MITEERHQETTRAESGLKLYWACILRNLKEDMYKEHGRDYALENSFQGTSYINFIWEIAIKKATETSREPSTFYQLCLFMRYESSRCPALLSAANILLWQATALRQVFQQTGLLTYIVFRNIKKQQ